jgi:hypothetical protein
MFHLAGRIAFGVNVGKLFQFQGAFQSDRKIDPATEVEKVRRTEKFFGQIFESRLRR